MDVIRGGVSTCFSGSDREESPLAANMSSSASNDAESAPKSLSCSQAFGDKLPSSILFLLMGLRSLRSPSLMLEAPEITGDGTMSVFPNTLSSLPLLLTSSVGDAGLTSSTSSSGVIRQKNFSSTDLTFNHLGSFTLFMSASKSSTQLTRSSLETV